MSVASTSLIGRPQMQGRRQGGLKKRGALVILDHRPMGKAEYKMNNAVINFRPEKKLPSTKL